MRLSECSAEKLNRLSRRKKIIFFGAGANMYYILDAYKEYQFEKRIAFVVDSNPDKIGGHVKYKDARIEIKPYSFLENVNLKTYTMVIAAVSYNEIFAQIQNISNAPRLRCYRAPRQRIKVWGWIKSIVCVLPLSDIILMSGEGDTCENARALGRYIAEKSYFGKYRLVWLCNHPERFKSSKNEIYLNRNTPMQARTAGQLIKYFWLVGRAKYVIFENGILPKMRTDQITVYLNHGSPPIKSTKGIINLPKSLNWALSPSKFSTDIIAEQYSINKERIMCCGSPRTDCLFELSDVAQIKNELKIDGYDKIILWAPTFRQRKNSNRVDSGFVYNLGVPIMESLAEYDKLNSVLKKYNMLLLLKLHLLQDVEYIKLPPTDNVRILTNEELENGGRNVCDLLKCADALLTDYSTIAFDYMLLDRPIGYTLDDKDEYRLGFSVDCIEELMPGNLIYAMDGLVEFIDDINDGKDVWAKKRQKVKDKTHDYPDAHNSERLCKMLGLGVEK